MDVWLQSRDLLQNTSNRSKVVNNGKLVVAKPGRTETHRRSMNYSIPAASFHRSEVAPDELHATFFLFDASQGYVQDAPVLGPKDAESSTQIRQSPGISPDWLVTLTQSVRTWQDTMEEARRHMRNEGWQSAFETLQAAYLLCEAGMNNTQMQRYLKITLAELATFMHTHSCCNDLEVAKWRLAYGQALLRDGQHEAALAQFNSPPTASTPMIAFSKSPSPDHLLYLRQSADAGADFGLVDEHGSTALDYTVHHSDYSAECVVLDALGKNAQNEVEGALHQRLREARPRNHTQQLFKQTVRPLLAEGGDHTLSDLRSAYAEVRDRSPAITRAFDPLEFVRFSDLKTFGRIPRSDDGLTNEYRAEEDVIKYLLFISYRWADLNPWVRTPDDAEHSQYRRTLLAVEDFVRLHPAVSLEQLGLWIDFACIDQDNPMSGVAALPLALAQCDAVISLVDEHYYERAWCSAEVALIQALRQSYGRHLWYEHKPIEARAHQPTNEPMKDITRLELGPEQFQRNDMLKNRLLKFEEDRPWILSLERQTKLLTDSL